LPLRDGRVNPVRGGWFWLPRSGDRL